LGAPDGYLADIAGSEPDVFREKAGELAIFVRKTRKSRGSNRQAVVVSGLIVGQQCHTVLLQNASVRPIADRDSMNIMHTILTVTHVS
jgi:hypothetical protein